MASFNSWNGVKMHGHEYLLTDVLRDQMGFNGLVVGDWNGHGEVQVVQMQIVQKVLMQVLIFIWRLMNGKSYIQIQ